MQPRGPSAARARAPHARLALKHTRIRKDCPSTVTRRPDSTSAARASPTVLRRRQPGHAASWHGRYPGGRKASVFAPVLQERLLAGDERADLDASIHASKIEVTRQREQV